MDGARAVARRHRSIRTRRRPPPSGPIACRRGYEDPEARCHLPGVPRALDQPGGLYPVQIIQDEKSVALLHEAMHDVRIIPTDNSAHPRNYWAWDGDSRGRWEGDTLVVDVSNFNGRTWLDMAANFVDENEHVVERFSLVGSRHHSVRGHDHRPNRLRQASTDALHVEAACPRSSRSSSTAVSKASEVCSTTPMKTAAKSGGQQ